VSEPYIEETTLDLRDLLKTLKKRRKLILSIFLIAVVTATIVSLLLPKVYQAETTLRVKQSKGLGDSLLASMPMSNPLMTKQQMSTYAEIMKSRTVLEAVIRKVYAGVPAARRPKTMNLLDRITTTPVRDTEILAIEVRANDPKEAQRLANTLVATFLGRITDLVRSEQRAVRKFIGERLAGAKAELRKAEIGLEGYKREQKITAADEESKAVVGQMADLRKLMAENEVNLAVTQARSAQTQAQLAKEKIGFVAENALIAQYKSKLGEQEVQLVGLLQKYTEKHPEVKALRAGIAETRSRLNQEIDRVVNAEASSVNPVHQSLLQGKIQSEVELAAAQAQKQALTEVIAAEENKIARLPEKERGLVQVMREASLAQEIYVMLSKRYEEAQISEVMQPTDVQVIDAAVVPKWPIKPKKTLNVLIAAFLGLFAGVGLAIALEYLNKTVNTADEVRSYLDLPVLGSIPDFGMEEQPQSFWELLSRKILGIRHKA
jgi:succinoglycan biosynthesis transport protein ExoP